MTRTWPDDWEARKAGDGCPSCPRVGVAEHDWGVRIFEGEFADVYMNYRGPSRGYCVSVWKQGHVANLTELSEEQVSGYWLETVRAPRAIEGVYKPAKLNFLALGNEVTHLHTHVVPRYLDDPEPGGILPLRRMTFAPKELHDEAARLRQAFAES